MINLEINQLIMSSMRDHNEVRTRTLRAIKDAFLKWTTAKENVGKTLDESTEINLIKKMIKTRTESADLYEQAGRLDLATNEKQEIDVLEEFIPKAATEEEIETCFDRVILNLGLSPTKADMGKIISVIKSTLPNADGALVARIVKSHIL